MGSLFYCNPSVTACAVPAPRKGEPLGVVPLTKSCPRKRGKWHEVPKGVRLKTAECRELFPLSFAYAQQLPRKRWRLWVQYKLGVQCRTPSRSDRFNGVTGGAGGPKGRNRNLPWPPCKKVIKKLICFLFISTPQSRLAPCQLPGRGAFWSAL